MSSSFISSVLQQGLSDLVIESRNKSSNNSSYFESELSNLNSFEDDLSECSYEILENEELSLQDKFSVLDKKNPSLDDMSVLQTKTSVNDFKLLNSVSDPLITASKLALGGISKFI